MLALRQEIPRIDPLRFFFDRYTRIPSRYSGPSQAFRQKIPIDFQRGDFRVTTLSNVKELEEVLQLRYDIFHREFQRKLFPYGIDLEPLDFLADHLAITHKPSQRIVGTYRIIASTYSDRFYSQSEFELSSFLARSGKKMELSRAGIHRDFRSGVVMALLWRGVSQYMKKIEADLIFGCASVKTVSRSQVNRLCETLRNRGHLSDEFHIRPQSSHLLGEGVPLFEKTNQSVELPALFEGYLRAGAVVSPEPALDREFKCVDFFTVLKISEMDQQFERKYGK